MCVCVCVLCVCECVCVCYVCVSVCVCTAVHVCTSAHDETDPTHHSTFFPGCGRMLSPSSDLFKISMY